VHGTRPPLTPRRVRASDLLALARLATTMSGLAFVLGTLHGLLVFVRLCRRLVGIGRRK
jgi:hypothetical protein